VLEYGFKVGQLVHRDDFDLYEVLNESAFRGGRGPGLLDTATAHKE
jgi:hypothetical protein